MCIKEEETIKLGLLQLIYNSFENHERRLRGQKLAKVSKRVISTLGLEMLKSIKMTKAVTFCWPSDKR